MYVCEFVCMYACVYVMIVCMSVGGLISFAPTVTFLFTLDVSVSNRFCVVAWYLSPITLHLEHTDAYSPHTVHIEMKEFSDVRLNWILNHGKSSSNWNSQTNASSLWRLGWWCEFSKILDEAVQRWRNGASRFEWQNTKWKACDCKWSTSSRSRCRTDAWKSSHKKTKEIAAAFGISNERVVHITGVLGFQIFVPDGYRACCLKKWKLKDFAFLGTSWNLLKKKMKTPYRRSLQVMKLRSIIMTLWTKGSPWNSTIRNHLRRKSSKHRPRLEKSCWLFFWNSERVVLADFLKKNNNKLSTFRWKS